MQNSKLISLLKSLSIQELREFRDYVQSPFFNKNKNVIALNGFLLKHHPDYDPDFINDESISMLLFPGEKNAYFKVRNISSDLYKLAKDYLAQTFYRDESVFYPFFLLEKLREKKLHSAVKLSLKSFNNELDEMNTKDEFYLLRRSELSQQEHFFSIVNDPLDSYHYFQKDFDNFLEYSLLRLLKFYCIMLHDSVQSNFTYEMKMFEQVYDFIKSKEEFSNPTLNIYSRILRLLLEKSEDSFFALKKLKKTHSYNLSREDRYMLDLYMSSFCASMFNDHSRTDFAVEHFSISDDQFNRGEMTVGNMLYPDFLIHVKIASRVGEFAWAEKFIDRYINEIPEDKGRVCIDFSNGYMYFMKRNFGDALEALSKCHFSNSLMQTQVKILMMKCNYELGYSEQLISSAQSFGKFLERDKQMPDVMKDSFRKFSKLILDLHKLNTVTNKKTRQSEIKQINSRLYPGISNLFGVNIWLREKAAALMR